MILPWHPAQYVIINTYTGKKNVYLLDGVTQAEIESYKNAYGVIDWDTVIEKFGTVINEYLDEDGDFIQLQDGTNTLTYSADEGTNYLFCFPCITEFRYFGGCDDMEIHVYDRNLRV